MPDSVKHPRAYRSERRREQALETRRRIVDAASAVFVRQGYGGATIKAIAADAGVAAETVYAVFGTKRELLAEAVGAAVRGDDPTPVLEQAGPRAVLAATDPREKLTLFASDIAGRLARAAPLLDVLAAAATQEPELRALHSRLHAARRENLRVVAVALAGTGALRPDVEAATDTIWALASPELYMLLTGPGGWERERHTSWLAATLAEALLEAEARPD